jgi:A/G-specific adenine glycosylase
LERLTPLQESVLAWFETASRDLPWRLTRDPWAVLVSESMLQQTQVARVIPKYLAFLECFPDPSACAAAPAGAVVRAWAGLGYNRRAVNLHLAAVAIVDRHGGRIPSSIEELMALPGIGAYTARAVSAFAFERPAAVVDTNVARVLARAVAGRRLAGAETQALADRVLPPARSWVWNQAMVDLGALVCTSRAPRCHLCPLVAARRCAWITAGRPEPDPAVGSAGTSGRQSAFAGSDRQGRGRLVAALRRGPLTHDRLAEAAGWPEDPARAARVAAGLVADGLAAETGAGLTLP